MMAAQEGEMSLVKILVGANKVDVNTQENVSIGVCSLVEILAMAFGSSGALRTGSRTKIIRFGSIFNTCFCS